MEQEQTTDKVLINVRMKTKLADDMKATCERMDVSISHFVRSAIKKQIEEQKRKELKEGAI
jgi:antitoxin component of RelBE/YafQ-DinJ toxin-antitoxin module